MSQKYHGLNPQQVEESRLKNGSNELTPAPKEPLWKMFIEKFSDPMIRILLIAAFLSLGIYFVDPAGHIYETIGIFFAIFLATGIAFFFEVDASRKFDILNQVNDETLVSVIRDGNVTQISKKELVVGDIILLEQGDEVPADAELLETVAMSLNESCLTGEPSISKSHLKEEFKHDVTYPSNMVYRGTTVIDGHGVARVITVGDHTEFGKVARQSTEKAIEITPLNRQLDRLAKLIGVVGLTLAVITFAALLLKDIMDVDNNFTTSQLWLLGATIIGAFVAITKVWMPIVYDGVLLLGSKHKMPKIVDRLGWFAWAGLGLVCFGLLVVVGYAMGIEAHDASNWIDATQAARILSYFMVAVTLIVVAVPEGLPMSVTLSLALSMRKMLKANNLVRKMHACETMGATTVICTDKTGTLTRNQMSVYFSNLDFDPMVAEAIAINTTANLDMTNASSPSPIGNPTEGALLLWLNQKGGDYAEIRNNCQIIDQIPFSTRHKFMATLVRKADGGATLHIKGAPEVIMAMCQGIDTAKLETELLEFQNKAMRTLALATYTYGSSEVPSHIKLDDIPRSGYTLLGYVAISDPVREDVPSAVKECMDAGIRIKIVTGDTPGTAREIGRQIGLWSDSTDSIDTNMITGPEWEALSDEEAYARAQKIKIMARARPSDKQRLVQMLQKAGDVVAVTGDGTNDAPALNFANVGLSMGSGTSVAKEASDITLIDDSFASIASAVMWGRSVYLNIQRFVLFQLTINVAALSLVFLGSMFGFELPLTVTQMLWVNLIMDTFAAGALASLPADHRVMKNKPRGINDFIITKPMAKGILGIGLGFVVLLMGILFAFNSTIEGETPYRMSVFFTIFVMLQFWNMFNAKAYASGYSAFHALKQSRGFMLVSLLIFAGQILIVSFGGDVFRVVPISLIDWVWITLGTSLVLWIGEIVRLIQRQKSKK